MMSANKIPWIIYQALSSILKRGGWALVAVVSALVVKGVLSSVDDIRKYLDGVPSDSGHGRDGDSVERASHVVALRRNNGHSNGAKGVFGFTLGQALRDSWVDRKADVIELELEGHGVVPVTLRKSFWNQCAHIDHPDVAEWVLGQGIDIPWPKGKPPKFELIRKSGQLFVAKRWPSMG